MNGKEGFKFKENAKKFYFGLSQLETFSFQAFKQNHTYSFT